MKRTKIRRQPKLVLTRVGKDTNTNEKFGNHQGPRHTRKRLWVHSKEVEVFCESKTMRFGDSHGEFWREVLRRNGDRTSGENRVGLPSIVRSFWLLRELPFIVKDNRLLCRQSRKRQYVSPKMYGETDPFRIKYGPRVHTNNYRGRKWEPSQNLTCYLIYWSDE